MSLKGNLAPPMLAALQAGHCRSALCRALHVGLKKIKGIIGDKLQASHCEFDVVCLRGYPRVPLK